VIRDVTDQESRDEHPHQTKNYSFNNIGISSFFMLLSTMPDEERERLGYYGVGGCGANIEWHTEEDLIHIADRDILVKDMRIYLAAAMGAANATIAPFDFAATLRGFARTLDTYAEAAGVEVDFSAAREAIRELETALANFAKYTRDLDGQPVASEPVRRANRAIRRLARLLVPVNYTRGPGFFHDPAESIPPLPDLHVALQVPSMPPAERGFARTHLVRGQNRLVAALRDSRRELEDVMS
jgi:hypothetical protein